MVSQMKSNDNWDKTGIRMSREGRVMGTWLVHESSPDTGFSCFDNGNNLVWIVKTEDSDEAIRLVDKIRIYLEGKNLWGSKKAKNIDLAEIDKMNGFGDYPTKDDVQLGEIIHVSQALNNLGRCPKAIAFDNAINIIYPYPKGKTWVFDDVSRGLVSEPFVFGSSEILTALTKIKFGMVGMQKFKLMFSKYPLPKIHAKFVKIDKEAVTGAWYKVVIDNQYVNGREGWLCPATLKYFKDYPNEIYVCLEEL